MTIQETKKIMAVLQVAFPSYYRGLSKEDALAAVNLWTEMFASDDYPAVAAAVKALIATQTAGYPPTIGAVKEKLAALREPERMTAQEAWALAAKAAAGDLAWDKLPPMVQRAIGSPNILRDWGMIDIDTFNTVIYSQFLKAYGAYDKREQELAVLPETVRALVAGPAERLALHG